MSVATSEMGRATRFARSDSRIGVILIRTGRLTQSDALRVMHYQHRRQGLGFGDAAIELGLIKPSDVQFAMTQQESSSYIQAGETKLSAEVVAAHAPTSGAAEALRALRSQLMLRWFQPKTDNKAVAVVGVERGVGRSWLAANLAVTFSQLGRSTVLLDADMRHPSQHQLFGLEGVVGLSEILMGRASLNQAVHRHGSLPALSVITAGSMTSNPQEMIARIEFEQLLDGLRQMADVIIIDTPAALECADAHIIATRASGALLVAQRDVSNVRSLRAYSDALRDTNINLIGSAMIDR